MLSTREVPETKKAGSWKGREVYTAREVKGHPLTLSLSRMQVRKKTRNLTTFIEARGLQKADENDEIEKQSHKQQLLPQKSQRSQQNLQPLTDEQVIVETTAPVVLEQKISQEGGLLKFQQQFQGSILPVPKLTIAILVVGTRGDINPFIQLAHKLKAYGHRVRLSSHEIFRQDILSNGIEYYPLGGDPQKLSAYAVKSEGRLIPKLDKKTWTEDVPEQMAMLKEIINSTWPACTQPDPEDPLKRPFMADAVISNPPTFAHFHIAEALCVPLQMMFPQPWTPTRAFPHPYSNEPYDRGWSWRNWYSYEFAETLQWLGVGSMINSLRKNMGIPHCGIEGASLLTIHRIPWVKMWSPALAPKPDDWGNHIEVVGNFFTVEASNYNPPQSLLDFLAAGEPPIYIGFGSVVIPEPEKITSLIVEAAVQTKTRVLLQSGWSTLGGDNMPPNIYCLGKAPHDWLFPRMGAVIHHGGAGTVAAGLKAGKPTMVCPFNADQFFWGEMIKQSQCGAPACPVKKLTTAILVDSFSTLKSEQIKKRAVEMSEAFAKEDGPANGMAAFHKNLPSHLIVDDISVFLDEVILADVYCMELNLKISNEVRAVLCSERGQKVLRSLPETPQTISQGQPLTFYDYSYCDFSSASILKKKGLFGKKMLDENKSTRRVGVIFVDSLFQARKLRKNPVFSHFMHVQYRKKRVNRRQYNPNMAISPERFEQIICAVEKAIKAMEIFRRFDRDGSNFLDQTELSVAIRELVVTNNLDALKLSEQIQDVVSNIIQNNGLIHFSEFAYWMKCFNEGKIVLRGVKDPKLWSGQTNDSKTAVQILQEDVQSLKNEIKELVEFLKIHGIERK